MINKARIEEEAAHFFEWPDPRRKEFVTFTSCLIFAGTIAEMVRAETREFMLNAYAQSQRQFLAEAERANRLNAELDALRKTNGEAK